jgi:FAD synthetase
MFGPVSSRCPKASFLRLYKSRSSSIKQKSDALKLYEKLRNCNDSYISSNVNNALTVISDSIKLYGPEMLFSSYNGGKDADVIMHLFRAAMAKYSYDNQINYKAKVVYFAVKNEFPEILNHIEESEKVFDLQLKKYDCCISQGLQIHIDQLGKGSCAFILGTRKSDPNCDNQEFFSPSSSWVSATFMRVNPIINWDYGHVWHFLRLFDLPYCSLYDQGYTSLGKTTDTLPNPALMRTNTQPLLNKSTYLPAYLLSDWKLERAGR